MRSLLSLSACKARQFLFFDVTQAPQLPIQQFDFVDFVTMHLLSLRPLWIH
jgi:hypothetical protein